VISLLVVRGLPGAGKTTFAEALANEVFSADDFFCDNEGAYHFDGARLKEAHEFCFRRAQEAVLRAKYDRRANGMPDDPWVIAVANVFARKEDIQPYASLARRESVRFWSVDLFDQNMTDERLARSTWHGVPVETIARTRAKWEP
jgi:predicted kinase